MKSETRKYVRDLSKSQIKSAQKAYKFHIKPKRDGFLKKNHRERLLHLKKWRDSSDRDVYDFFYDLRERARSALVDFQMISEFLTEKELKSIFTETKQGSIGYFPLTLFLSSLLPPIEISTKTKQKDLNETDWRKLVLEDVVLKALSWYANSGVFQTDSHRRLLIDTMDAITIMSSGEKRVVRHTFDSFYETSFRKLNEG